MANNRMFLVHRPSGLAVSLGKRMTDGWYISAGPRGGEKRIPIADLFDRVEAWCAEHGWDLMDDFMVAMEHADGAPMAEEVNMTDLTFATRMEVTPAQRRVYDAVAQASKWLKEAGY